MNLFLKVLVSGLFLLSSGSVCSVENNIKECNNLRHTEKHYKKYLENTVWIVPPQTLLSYQYSDGNNIPTSDQTVWIINEYNHGYFFGDSYTALNGVPGSHRKIVGSITPDGEVYITFYPLSENTHEADLVNGIGTFKKHNRKYFFTMQMNSAQNSFTGLSHWSFMLSVKPKDYFYQHLPGIDISVPEFISLF